MAKRPTIEVDEDYLKEVMAGGAVLPKREKAQPGTKAEQGEQQASPPQTEPPVKEEKDIETHPVETVEAKEPAKPARKRKEAGDYEAVFLQRKAGVPRRQTYISASLYEKINSFLPVIAGGLSITGYIDNILTLHLEQYKEDINELYEKKSQKPF
ncbi:transposase [Bacteroidia bacterium]|nr:transposase [Bacteroidia bacterium]GHV39143.1 transposase [Bacteroidia bacterium]